MHVRMPHFQQESTASMFLLLVAVVELVITVAVVVQVAGCLTKPASWCLVLLTSSSGLAVLLELPIQIMARPVADLPLAQFRYPVAMAEFRIAALAARRFPARVRVAMAARRREELVWLVQAARRMQLLGQTPIMQVVAVAVAGSLLPRVVQAVLAVVELAVVPEVTMDQAAPTDSAAVVVADLPAHLQLVAVARALSLCVTQTCPPFRANPQHERCRLVRRPHSQ
jgi:hypothetical protein